MRLEQWQVIGLIVLVVDDHKAVYVGSFFEPGENFIPTRFVREVRGNIAKRGTSRMKPATVTRSSSNWRLATSREGVVGHT
jgi:hypothetical protein